MRLLPIDQPYNLSHVVIYCGYTDDEPYDKSAIYVGV